MSLTLPSAYAAEIANRTMRNASGDTVLADAEVPEPGAPAELEIPEPEPAEPMEPAAVFCIVS